MEAFLFKHEYVINELYKKPIAYLCMEFGIEQPLKTYAGGLGFLAGSFMRSAYSLRQNIVGIGILWKYGYYNQVRKQDQTMDVLFEEKRYGFLIDTQIKFKIKISKHDVWVKAFYLPSSVFKTAPIFFLSTDLAENDYLSQTISHKLYDANPETSIAAAILLGEGAPKLLEQLKWEPEIYHLNESHALPLAFNLFKKYKHIEDVRNKMVFTNHTPEESGNRHTNITLLDKMGYFTDVPLSEVISISASEKNLLNHTLTALKLAGKANGVSKIHRNTLHKMWNNNPDICEIISITNAQQYEYWKEISLYEYLDNKVIFKSNKKILKNKLFQIVADQCGEIYDENICTIVFAKRFVDYKRPDIFFHNMERFEKLITNKERPVQIIWAGKPYPMDYNGIGVFDKIVNVCKRHNNCSILINYELTLSKLLKGGADIWLNTPRLYHEASGTSGMSAAMNGAVNVAMPDGWFPEFAKDKMNSFIIPPCDNSLPDHIQDDLDANSLYNLIENEILPTFYDYPDKWNEIMINGMKDVIPLFDSNRMADEYYKFLYNFNNEMNVQQ